MRFMSFIRMGENIQQQPGRLLKFHITGKNLQLVTNRLIVQSWRAQSWSGDDIDSTFIIYLEPQGADTLLHAVHANIPDSAVEGIDAGWHKMYWEPWKLYLAGTPIAKASM